MFSSYVNRSRSLWTYEFASRFFENMQIIRHYADDEKCKRDVTACTRAHVDIPRPDGDAECPLPCKRKQKKKIGIMHKIKLSITEGGTNFGTPFHWLDCAWRTKAKEEEKNKPEPVETPALPEPQPTQSSMPNARPGVQVTILGADTPLGQYTALLLKQCPQIKKLRLYEASESGCCSRTLCNVVEDLKHIDTNCLVQAYGCQDYDLNLSLQATDIVLMLENAYSSPTMPIMKRFEFQAPLVKRYADAIARESPTAFIIVCATPIDCMVPLIAETLKETDWYDPAKLLGSMAVQEMRASTLAARALCLEPQITRVPCVGGTEGDALVPLFSKAVDFFEFNRQSSEMMTETVRCAPLSVARCEGPCMRAAELSEAYALSGLVTNVANALLCHDVPRVSGFVETDAKQVLSPARFIANQVELGASGIVRNLGLPKLNEAETTRLNVALSELKQRVILAKSWHAKCLSSTTHLHVFRNQFFAPTEDNKRYLAMDLLLNRHGICKQLELPYNLSDTELHQLAVALADKLLNKLEENEPELATSPEEECVICVNAKATMQTSPCGHRVVCRRCFVKTIQMAVSQRLLPLRCVICRAKILRLRQAPRLVTSKSWQVTSGSGKVSWGVPGSVSSYSVGARSVPASASLYSVTSGESSISGVSSVSSNSGGNVSNTCSAKLCGGAKCGGACLGAVPRASASAPAKPRQPASNVLRRSQHQSMKARLQDYQVLSYTGGPAGESSSGRLPPIREFQREFREGRRETNTASSSTRIRCAQKIVTQLEISPEKSKTHFFRPLKPTKEDPPESRDHSRETELKKDKLKGKPKKKDEENSKQDEKSRKDETNDNKKNEIAERKKEEKLRLKAEKEAKKEAKLLAKEEERQAKLLTKEEEKQAKLLAKEEKKRAKKEAKLAAQAEKEKEKSK